MLVAHSVAILPLQVDEVEGLRRLARSERGFAAAASLASRLTFISAASGGRLDPEATVGLRLRETEAIIAVARTPARTSAERAWKATLLRSWRDGGGGDPLLDAMIEAALAAERMMGRRTERGARAGGARAVVTVGRDANRRAAYESHVGSAAWRGSAARLEELRLSGHRCRICDSGPPDARLDVHHRSYKHFGAERVEDLTTLCRACHLVITDALRRRRQAGASLPPLCDTPRVLPGRTVDNSR